MLNLIPVNMRKLIILGCFFAVMLAAGCKSDGESDARYTFAVIPKAVGFDFWNSVKGGAEQAAQELSDVRVIWKGMHDETDVAGQVALVESFINQGVDAIVIAAADSRGLVPVLRKANDAGITLITIDSNTDPQVSQSFIATNNEDAAAQAADLIAEALQGQGSVALIPYVAGASTSNAREQGFRRRLAAHPGLKLVATQYSNSDYGRAMTVTEDILTAHPNLSAIFAANEPSVLGAAQAIRSRGATGKVILVGFDASPRQIEGVRDGSIYGLIVQDPFRMGYEGVMRAYAALNGEDVPEQIDSGSRVVTRENVDR